jgi:hypothetical protein
MGVWWSPPTTAQGGMPTRRRKPSGCGQTEFSEEGGFGGLPRLRQSNSHARRRMLSRAPRPGRAQRRRGFGSLPRLRHNTARPCAEECLDQQQGRGQRKQGFRGLPRLRLNTAHPCAEDIRAHVARPISAKKGRSGESPDYGIKSYARRRRPSRAKRGTGVLGFLPTTAIGLARMPQTAEPSTTARPSRAPQPGQA